MSEEDILAIDDALRRTLDANGFAWLLDELAEESGPSDPRARTVMLLDAIGSVTSELAGIERATRTGLNVVDLRFVPDLEEPAVASQDRPRYSLSGDRREPALSTLIELSPVLEALRSSIDDDRT